MPKGMGYGPKYSKDTAPKGGNLPKQEGAAPNSHGDAMTGAGMTKFSGGQKAPAMTGGRSGGGQSAPAGKGLHNTGGY